MARGVQQVDHVVAVHHLHDRGRHRNPALLLNLHPVTGRMARRLTRFHGAGNLDRPGKQQQLLRQRGLAGVRVGNDGKRATPPRLGKKSHEWGDKGQKQGF